MLAVREYLATDREAIEQIAEEIVEDGTVFPFYNVAGVCDYWFGNPHAQVFVAIQDQQVLGSYVLKPLQPDRGSHIANAGYMVANAARGRGIGRQMAEHSLAVAAQSGYRAIQFNQVVATNTIAIALWESLGFQLIGRIPQAFQHPQQGLVDSCIFYLAFEDAEQQPS